MFEQLNDQLLVNSRLSLTPHWIDLNLNFLMIKNYGPKNPSSGRNLGPKFPPYVGRSPKKIWKQFRPYIKSMA